MKISFRKQQSELSESAKTKPAKDKMIIKAYVAAQAPTVDRQQIDEEKLRMHREYMEMYRMEHEKTAGKDSSINMSELGISPTYTILPVQESTSAKHCRSYIVGTSTSRQVRFSLDQCKCEDPSEAKICQDTVTQTVVTNSCMQQMENSSSVEYESCEAKTDQFQKRTLSVKRNDVVKTVSSCQTDEVEENFLDERSSYVDGASGMSQWQLAQQPPSMTNQSSQTSPKIAGPTVSSYMSQCQGIIRKQTTTQTDIQSDSRDWQECPQILTHEQLLSLNQENAVQRPTTRRDLATVSEQPTFSGTLEVSKTYQVYLSTSHVNRITNSIPIKRSSKVSRLFNLHALSLHMTMAQSLQLNALKLSNRSHMFGFRTRQTQLYRPESVFHGMN